MIVAIGADPHTIVTATDHLSPFMRERGAKTPIARFSLPSMPSRNMMIIRIIDGPCQLEQYPAALEKLPLFERTDLDAE